MEMPGYDVRVMLHDAENDLVARADILQSIARRGKIDRLGRGAREYDLLGSGRVQETSHALPRRLIGLGGGIGEIMQPSMDIGVFVLIRMSNSIEDGLRLLRGGGIVQIHERLAVGPLREDRKVRSE